MWIRSTAVMRDDEDPDLDLASDEDPDLDREIEADADLNHEIDKILLYFVPCMVLL